MHSVNRHGIIERISWPQLCLLSMRDTGCPSSSLHSSLPGTDAFPCLQLLQHDLDALKEKGRC